MVEIHPHILFLVHIRQMALAGPVGIFLAARGDGSDPSSICMYFCFLCTYLID